MFLNSQEQVLFIDSTIQAIDCLCKYTARYYNMKVNTQNLVETTYNGGKYKL